MTKCHRLFGLGIAIEFFQRASKVADNRYWLFLRDKILLWIICYFQYVTLNRLFYLVIYCVLRKTWKLKTFIFRRLNFFIIKTYYEVITIQNNIIMLCCLYIFNCWYIVFAVLFTYNLPITNIYNRYIFKWRLFKIHRGFCSHRGWCLYNNDINIWFDNEFIKIHKTMRF